MKKRSKKSAAKRHASIHSFCGIFKLKPGEKSVVQEHLEERHAEREKEKQECERIKLIRSARGSLKRKPGDKSLVEMLMEERRAELEKEDRFVTPGKSKRV